MKKRKTNFIKLGILLFGVVSILWNCEKDDSNLQQEIQQKNKAYRISFKDFESNIDVNTLYNKLLPHFKTNVSYQQRNIDSTNSTILTNEIVKM